MDNMPPAELPDFLDPLLDYLSDHIPPSLYDTLITVLSQALSLFSSAFHLLASLSTWKPWEWDAQKVLPPLISVLAAYYALLSMYRTTGWMFRMAIRAVKWSVIIGMIGAGFGWMMANDAGDGQGGDGGGFAGVLRNVLQGQDAGDRRAARRGGAGAGGGSRARTGRPRPWDSFTAHQDWQHQGEQQDEDDGGVLSVGQQVMHHIVQTVGRVDFMSVAKNVLESVAGAAEDGEDDDATREGGTRARATRKQPKRKAKSKAGRTNPR